MAEPTGGAFGWDEPDPSPFEVFLSHATGGGVARSAAGGTMAARSMAMMRSRAIVAAVALIVVAGLVWWVQSAMGTGGVPMDPDLPLAADVQTTIAGSASNASAGVTNPDGDGDATVGGGSDDQSVGGDPGSKASEKTGSKDTLIVHVAGAVMTPGVHGVPSGARVHDAVTAAGGPRQDADLDRLNLAGPVADGARIYVPVAGEAVSPTPVDGGSAPSGDGTPTAPVPSQGQTISLTSASEVELQTLPGVGPSTAAAIVAHRTANGPFSSVDELLDVRGIGPAKLAAIRDLVVP